MTVLGRLRAAVLVLLAAVAVPGAPMGVPLVLGAAGAASFVSEAWAQSRGRSSGGYSRPASRTPSFTPSAPSPRTPSFGGGSSGGYSRPGVDPTRVPSGGGFGAVAPSAGDRAISRERSAQALQDQRAREQQAQEALRRQQQPPPAPSVAPSAQGWLRDERRRPSVVPQTGPGGTWFAQQGWQAPGYAAAAPRSFGVWDGLFLWFMLDNLTKPGYANFFRNQSSDPGLQQWRSQADALARDNEDLRRKLADLDARTGPGAAPADGAGGWVEVPADIPAGVAKIASARTPGTEGSGAGFGTVLVVVLVLVGAAGVAIVILRRRRRQGGDPNMTPLQSAAAMMRNVVAPKPYMPSHFRVGMVMRTDLSPFILAAGATKVQPPEASSSGTMTVAALGRVGEGAAGLVRLHLADRRSLFQLHLDAQGNPDECRFFTLFDEVAPADAAEWGVWLDAANGMIGWPEFQTQDGKLYARAWSPGTTKVAPMLMAEEITTAEGSETVRQQAMLYAAATGLPAPAPPTEYILVSAVERAGQAWVELRAGIDINPAALELT